MKLWIARDIDESLWLYYDKPFFITEYKCYSALLGDRDILLGELEKNLFPEVTFGNSPQQVELKLINYENENHIDDFDDE